MADEIGFQPLPQDDGVGFQPMPKVPDTSGVQKMAQNNLAANDNKEKPEGEPKPPQTPVERLNTGAGFPVDKVINGIAASTDFNAQHRSEYVKALDNGSASDSSDWMQSILPAVSAIAFPERTPYVLAQKQRNLEVMAQQNAAFSRIGESGEEGAKEGLNFQPFGDSTYLTPRFLNIPFQLGAGVTESVLEGSRQIGEEVGYRGLGADVEALLNALPMIHGATPHPELRELTAKKLGKEPSAVTQQDVNQVIADGSKDLHPPAKDFATVSTVTGIPESALKIVYKETGATPEKVFTDSQSNPAIATDIIAGKVPKQYEHMVEEKPVLPPTEAGKLHVARDETSRSFMVTDEEGDHVSGGFDSAEEARHYVEDQKFKAEERAAIEEEGKTKSSSEGKQQIIPGAEKITEKSLAERIMGKLLGSEKEQKSANEGLFDVAARSQQDLFTSKTNIIPPSESGRVTSLRSFLSNNGAKFNEANELKSIKKNGEIIKGKAALEYAHEISKEHGYLPKDEAERPSRPLTDLQNALAGKGGRDVTRIADADRVAKAKEAAESRKNFDPAKIEHEAYSLGIDAEKLSDETDKQYISRLSKAIKDFYKAEEGTGASDIIRQAIGSIITSTEKYAGKLTGSLFEKLGDAYIKTFQPELTGSLAKRADAYMAKYKASLQEAEHAQYRLSKQQIRRWDRSTSDERMAWLNDHDTGRWSPDEDPDHARFQALFDATFKAEKEAIGADAEKGYKDNYLPHAWEDPEAAKKYFNSDAYIKKYGKDAFTKRSEFQLVQDGVRAGLKLKTDNPERMLVARLLAGQDMIRTMDLLKDMESSGIAKKAATFSIDKKIAKTQSAIDELEEKYKKEFEKANDPAQERMEGIEPATSKKIELVKSRLNDLYKRLEDFNKEKDANKLTSDQIKELKDGFRIIGPDSNVWNIHQQVGPLWKNAMEMKGLWENQGVKGDLYRGYMQAKAIWTQVKLGLSLFHPIHVAMIDLASDIAASADHLIQGGKFSEVATKENFPNIGLTRETAKLRDHPTIQAWNTDPKLRTPDQQQMVSRMIEGGVNPIMSARDTVHFRENFDKAIKGVGLNNLRLISTAISLPGVIMKPFFEHWIPGMKAEIYLRRYQDALDRDPSLIADSAKRGEVARQIGKDTDRTYGEMNNDVQFWNRNLRDSFNAAFISGGWKLAQIYNARGLLTPAKIAYKFAKTGDFNKSDITFNMLHAYAYTGLTLALGGAINAALGNPIGTAKDTVWDIIKNLVAPQTGEKNPDGTPIRLNQPAFAKEAYNIAHEINTKGILAGAGSFVYHQTLLPSIVDTLSNRDFTGKDLISDPTDLHQWTNAGWNTIAPISISQYEKAETKGSKVGEIAGLLGFPMAGAYLNQTPFEQKVIAKYDELNPPKGDAYQAKLKADLKSAITSHDAVNQHDIEKRMKEEGMSEHQIEAAKKTYKEPFAEHAWQELSSFDQKRLIESASDEEKKKFKVKSQ